MRQFNSFPVRLHFNQTYFLKLVILFSFQLNDSFVNVFFSSPFNYDNCQILSNQMLYLQMRLNCTVLLYGNKIMRIVTN